jgi:hypothetical protein
MTVLLEKIAVADSLALKVALSVVRINRLQENRL